MRNYEIIMILDTREKKNEHIKRVLNANDIKYVERKLDYGDYSFYIEFEDGEIISFEDKIVVERKKDLDEIVGNITKERVRFEAELERCYKDGCDMFLVIEDANWYENIAKENYGKFMKRKISGKSVRGSLMSYEARYGVVVVGVEKNYFASYIFNKFKWYAKSYLIKNKNVEKK